MGLGAARALVLTGVVAACGPEEEDGRETSDRQDTWPWSPSGLEVGVRDVQRGEVPAGTGVAFDELVITAVLPLGLFVQEPEGGPWSGIFVHLGPPRGAGETWHGWYVRGDEVTVYGTVHEYAQHLHGYDIPARRQIVSDEDRVILTGVAGEPEAEPLAPEVLATHETARRWQGVLVGLEDVWVQKADIGHGEWLLWPNVRVSTDLADFGHKYRRDSFEVVAGVVDFSHGSHKVLPRDLDDFQGYHTNVLQTEDLRHGDLVINEVLVDGRACPGKQPQFLEILSPGARPIDLDGLLIDTARGHVLFEQSQVLDAGSVLWGQNDDAAACYGRPAHFHLSPRLGALGHERIALWAGNQLVDEVDFGTEPFPEGRSLQLDPRHASATENDQLAHWCPSTEADGELVGSHQVDLASPGFANATYCEQVPDR